MNGTCSNREICEQRRVCWCKERTRAFGEQMRRPASKCCRRCWSHHRPAHKITGTMRRWGQEKSEENNPCLIASLVFAHIVAIRELGRILREFFVCTALGHDNKCDFDRSPKNSSDVSILLCKRSGIRLRAARCRLLCPACLPNLCGHDCSTVDHVLASENVSYSEKTASTDVSCGSSYS